MCTYQTEKIVVRGSGKGARGWFPVTDATVYFDHPAHFPDEHSLNIDFLNPREGVSARVAVELDSRSARALAAAIVSALDSEAVALLEGPASEGPASEGPASEGRASEGPASEGPASEGPASEGPASEGPA